MPPHEISPAGAAVARWLRPLALLPLFLAAVLPASAASQAEVEGAHVTLTAIESESAIRAALDIDLKPGWKTYWISPGAAGLAPRIDFGGSEGITGVELSYPVPTRFLEGDIESIGYVEPASIAIEAQRAPGPRPVLRAQILIGLCRELCLPLQLQLETEPSTSLGARAAVRRAFDALPAPNPAPGWQASLSTDGAALKVSGPSGALATASDLFVSGPEGWAFAKPSMTSLSGQAHAKLPVLSRPSAGPALERVDLMLTDGGKGELIRALPVRRN
ncbi:protein-disulfide reductase DsbD domain-containing protein [Aureimonas sp. AU40]|uniref:protein-disulfide reductase DsbD domain-containing protein n=1 Tax=Aureimonas sp. AU40 TaxID=1637747 RepID=UPI000AFA0B53|nr:protein-disulfide reductase DsbD domain-containing protein [Aureimonas sp. AU40]